MTRRQGRIPVAPRISRPERVVSTRPARTDPRSWRGPNYRIVHHRAWNIQVYGQDNPKGSRTDGRDATRSMTLTFSTILLGSDSDVEYVDGRAPAPFLTKLDPFQGGTWGNRWSRSAKRLPFFNLEKTECLSSFLNQRILFTHTAVSKITENFVTQNL